jgi:tRNA1(Val) A37 N6-methylase TrmN6
MGNNLFNEATIKRLVSNTKFTLKQKKFADEWIELIEEGELKKEKEGYLKFYDIILKGLLGYDNIKHEKEHVEFSYEKEDKTVVRVEAKGMSTKDLFKKQNRVNPESPIDQIKRYMSGDGTPYGIVTNYQKFILFQHEVGYNKYYEFDFLSIKKDKNKLKEFLAIFSKESIDNGFVVELRKESEIQDKQITNDLYKIYHETRLMLLKEFEENGIEKNEALHNAQLFLNRLMFVFFAEDIGLIKRRILEELIFVALGSRLSENTKNVCSSIKYLFEDLDKGSKENNLFGFNGGLFKQKISENISFKDWRDAKSFIDCKQNYKFKEENLKIGQDESAIYNKNKSKLNPIVRNILLMSSYKFNTEVKVEVLGHIFEQSLADLEELKEDGVSKRKKDGVFYTPEYITDYICRNTIVPYLSNKGKNDVVDLIKEYKDNIGELEDKLKKIKILDPACGSGAFLIKAIDILLEIFKGIQDVKDLGGEYSAKRGLKAKSNIQGQFTLKRWNEKDEIRKIIENNIFGVDINEESVEITKLSLFLKIVRGNKKLPILSNNIKQGNSLIDDKEVAGDLVFDWDDKKKGFGEILENGGFDVVIGNPPYVKARDYEDVQIRKYIDNKYKTAYKMWDLYVPFIERGVNLLKKDGNFSMIIPDTLGKAEYTSKLVNWIESDCHLYQIDFFPEIYVFENVGVKSKIIFIKKQKQSKKTKRVAHISNLSNIKKLKVIDGKEKYLYEQSEINLKFSNCLNLDNICLVSYGLRLNSDKYDKKEKFKKEDLLSEKRTEINNKSYTEGKFLERYVIKKKLFVEWGTERSPNRLVRPTFPELYSPEKLLMSRQKRIATLSTDGEICDNTIIMGILVKDLHGVENKSISKYFKNIGKDRLELEKISENYSLSYILSLINSKLMNYFIKYNSKGEIDTYPDDWKKIPIPKISPSDQKPFIEKADLMLKLNKEFYERKEKFLKLLKHEYKIEKITKKLDNFYELEFEDFMGQLKVNLKMDRKAELLDFFEKNKKDLVKLKEEIDKTDKEIDKMVYKLYGLNSEEIRVVEGGLQ